MCCVVYDSCVVLCIIYALILTQRLDRNADFDHQTPDLNNNQHIHTTSHTNPFNPCKHTNIRLQYGTWDDNHIEFLAFKGCGASLVQRRLRNHPTALRKVVDVFHTLSLEHHHVTLACAMRYKTPLAVFENLLQNRRSVDLA